MQRSWEILPSDISEQEAAGEIINSYEKKTEITFLKARNK